MGGRGSGKTRGGAEWVRECVEVHGVRHVALVGATAADTRDIMVLGKESGSGLLDVCPPWNKPTYYPSKRVVVWPNGALATLYSAEEPDRLNGPQHGAAWGDEPGVWARGQETLDMLLFGLRLGTDPRLHLTSTPKPAPWFVDYVMGRKDEITGLRRPPADVAVTHSTTDDNAANLAPPFLARLTARYGGTRLEQQERRGLFLDDVEGALWKQATIDAWRVDEAPPLVRVVVAIDPATSVSSESDETGIVVAGCAQGTDGRRHYYVIDDEASGRHQPLAWSSLAWGAFDDHAADRVVYERNQGGDMVWQTLASVRPAMRSALQSWGVHAARGKVVRAEPVAALYEQGLVHHVGVLPRIEGQLTTWVPGRASPDRLDALVYAVTDLMGAGGPVAAPEARSIGRHKAYAQKF